MNTLKLRIPQSQRQETERGVRNQQYRNVNSRWCIRFLDHYLFGVKQWKELERQMGIDFPNYIEEMLSLGHVSFKKFDMLLLWSNGNEDMIYQEVNIKIGVGKRSWGARHQVKSFIIEYGKRITKN